MSQAGSARSGQSKADGISRGRYHQAALPTSTNVRPAVWITQPSSTTYRYASFPTNSTTKADLAGSVVACWNIATSNIEIFFVDKNGKKS